MKLFISFLVILFAVLAVPVMAIAQAAETVAVQAAEVFDPSAFFVSLSALVSAVIVVTQWFKARVKSVGFWTKFLSWAVSAALSLFGWLLHLGIFEGVAWYWMLGYAFAAGLVANSIFDLGVVTAILNLFKSKANAS